MKFFGYLSRYLARHVLVTSAMVWLVLVGFDLISQFANELDEIGKGGYTLSHAALTVMFSAPRKLYETFPYVAVIGSLLGLGGLAARSELTAMRAAGVSRMFIASGVLLAIASITVLMIFNMEWLAPGSEQQSQRIENEGKSNQIINARYSGLWARDGQVFLNAQAGGIKNINGKLDLELRGVRLFHMDADGRVSRIVTATIAQRQDKGWQLTAVEDTEFLANGIKVQKEQQRFWPSTLDRRALESAVVRSHYLSTRELRNNIQYLNKNNLDSSKATASYWSRWFYPINIIALVFATLPFAFTSLRSGGFGKRLFIGMVIGIGFMLAQRLLVDLANVYRFDVRLALAIPPLALFGLSYYLFRRIE